MFTFETAWDIGPAEVAQPAWDEETPSEPTEPTEAKGQRVRVRRNRRGKDAEEVGFVLNTDDNCISLSFPLYRLISNNSYLRLLVYTPYRQKSPPIQQETKK